MAEIDEKKIYDAENEGADRDSEQVVEIELSQLFPFKNHPFHVPADDEPEMAKLIESVKQKGVMTPGTVRPMPNGSGYEIISGHRRKRACEAAGLSTMPVIVKDCDDDEAALIMVTSNIQREGVRESEKVKAYSLMYEAMKHQGKIRDNDRRGSKSTRDVVGKIAGVNGPAIRRYVELARLSDGLLDMLDQKRMKLSAGAFISSLSPEEQKLIQDFLTEHSHVRISMEQAKRIKERGMEGTLSREGLAETLTSESPAQMQTVKITLTLEELSRYFSGMTNEEQIKEKIFALLDEELSRSGNNA